MVLPEMGTGELVASWPLATLDGTETDIANFKERVLFVNRWATWCAPCIVEMPEIQALRDRLADADVGFVIVSDEAPDEVRAFADEQGWDLPLYTSPSVPSALASEVLPATFLLGAPTTTGDAGAERDVLFKQVGIAHWDDDDTADFIRNLIEDPTSK